MNIEEGRKSHGQSGHLAAFLLKAGVEFETIGVQR